MTGDVVVVLNYHGRSDTERCVASLMAGESRPSVVVVDNGSFDGALEAVHGQWPEVATLQTGDNLGFAGGMNAGIAWALDRGAETVTVLNNDTVVSPMAVAVLADRARRGFAVSPVVRYMTAPTRVWFEGGIVDADTGLARHLQPHEVERHHPVVDGMRTTETLAGCCVTASAETWRTVGMFDERYFLIFEDSDWSLRARQRGVELIVAEDVSILHAVSASFTGAHSYVGLYYYTRNGLLFGRERCSSSILQRARFLRRHVVPQVSGQVRRRSWTEAQRNFLMIASAIHDVSRKRFGRARPSIEARARRWSGQDVR